MAQRRSRIRWIGALAGVALGASIAAVPAGAQIVSAPVLQNAFANAGITVAGNYGDSHQGRSYVAAAAWAPGSARFQVSGGLGAFQQFGNGTHVTYGARVAVPVLHLLNDLAGVGVFAGIGGASLGTTESLPTGGPLPSGATVNPYAGWSSLLDVPVGASIAYRHALGATHAASLYLAPFYQWTRASGSGMSASGGVGRLSVGADVGLTSAIGVTFGYETGAKATNDNPGPTGGLFGIGVSYALRRASR